MLQYNKKRKHMKILKFSAPWCGPCKALAQLMERIESPFPVQEVNVDEEGDMAAKYSVRAVPMLALIDGNGNVIATTYGGKTEGQLREFYESCTTVAGTVA
jgi:thioredoxin 1